MPHFDEDGLYCGPEYDNDDPGCPACGASLYWEECDMCAGDGVNGHDCGEDTCCCRYPEDNVMCDQCEGYGGWYVCHEPHEGQRCWLPNEIPADPA